MHVLANGLMLKNCLANSVGVLQVLIVVALVVIVVCKLKSLFVSTIAWHVF